MAHNFPRLAQRQVLLPEMYSVGLDSGGYVNVVVYYEAGAEIPGELPERKGGAVGLEPVASLVSVLNPLDARFQGEAGHFKNCQRARTLVGNQADATMIKPTRLSGHYPLLPPNMPYIF